MDIKKIYQSKKIAVIIFAAAGLLLLLAAFRVGVAIGERKADFSCKWSDNYSRNLKRPDGRDGRAMGMPEKIKNMGGMNDRGFMGANGVSGKIIKIDNDVIIIDGIDGMERPVIVSDKTIIRRSMDSIGINDLAPDDQIVVIGSPNNAGQIEAGLIRVFPFPSNNGNVTPPSSVNPSLNSMIPPFVR